ARYHQMRAIPGGGTLETAAGAAGAWAYSGDANNSIAAQSGRTQRNKESRNKGSLGIGRLLPLYIRTHRRRFDNRRPSHFRVAPLSFQSFRGPSAREAARNPWKRASGKSIPGSILR